jgi:hypothetical protein
MTRSPLRRGLWSVATACIPLLMSTPALGDVKSQAAREAAEYVFRKFGKEAASETVETLARKLETAALKHGDEVYAAARQVGPRALFVAAQAGAQSKLAYQLMARYGDNAVAMVLSRPQALKLVGQLGEEAAEQLIKHPGIAEPLLAQGGKNAVQALNAVGPQGGRRMAMLLEDGTLAAGGKADALLGVVSKYGEKGLDFIWRNKGKLTVAAALTAFLANPEPFINGTKDLAQIAGESVVKPVTTAIAGSVNWTYVLLAIAGLICVGLLVRRRRRAAVVPLS